MMYRQFVARHSHEGSDRNRRLPSGTTVEEVADACRDAILSFLHGSEHGWTPSDLMRWRIGPCERALVASRLDAPVATLPPSPVKVVGFEEDVCASRARALEILAMCKQHPSNRFAQAMVDHGVIERIHDASGAVGWAPTTRAGLKLAERLGTFIIADCLTRPRDYERLAIHGDAVCFVHH